MNAVILLSSFVLGIGGSLHCLGMCGPLALSVPFAQNGSSGWPRMIVFYLAKALAYGFLGGLSGLLGKGLILMNWQQGLSVAAGLVILLMACLPVLKPETGNFLFRKQFMVLYERLQRRTRLYDFAFLGFLNGLLPCGLVYTALVASIVAGGWVGGFMAMFVFGLGTIPALVLLVLFRSKMSLQLRKRLKPASVILSICIGGLLILRGMNLGIPYVSPEIKGNAVRNCCIHK